MRIITRELVEKAIELAKPTIIAILNAEGTTWGPKWVIVYVKAPGIEEKITVDINADCLEFNWGLLDHWEDKWGKREEFFKVAASKLDVSDREKLPTSIVVATMPWLLKNGEYLYAGGSTRDGISVGVSGAKGRTDEGIAEIILSIIRMLAFLGTEKRIQENKMQI
jgi:hypothetical protein